MDKEKIKQFITSQRENGVPDDQIHSFLVSKGVISLPKKEEPPKPTIAEKIGNFTGGTKIAQGLGQALANPEISKQIDETMAMQADIQEKLIARLKQKQEAGEDTTATERALALITDDIKKTGNETGKLLNQNDLTTKEVLGDALQLATTAGGAKLAGSIVGKTTSAVGVGNGIVQGAKTGALSGTALGGLTGVSQGLKDNKSGSEIAKDAVSGAITGSITGGVLGGVVGGVSGGVKASRIKKENNFLENITPKTTELTPTEYEDLLRKGKITPKTSTSPARYVLSEKEVEVATKYKHLIGNKDPVKNSIGVMEEISKKDKEVGNFLRKNNGIFNKGELRNYLAQEMKDVTDITIDPTRLDSTKQTMIDNFIAGLKKNDMENLWTGRKNFDSTIEKAFSGSPTLQKEIKRSLRNGVQNFIADRTPEGVYKASMKDMTELFNLQEIISTKATKEKNISALTKWIKDNPKKVKGLEWLVGGAIIGKVTGVID